jgi:DNA-binding transcriptional LysR family regulator
MRQQHVSSGVDLRQLEVIRAIADAGSFTAAGEKLRVSQSAISRQILLLEEELGEAVFHRIGRRIRITPAGEALLQLSHRVFQDLEDTVSTIGDTQESLRGTMRLVGGMTVCLYVFPALLAEVRRRHPNLDLKITVGSAERSIAMLRSGAGDLGLVTLPMEATDLVSVPVLEEELLLVTYPTHLLAARTQVMPADLNRQPFILFEAGSITRRLVDEFFTRERIECDIVMETENVEIIKAMVRHGLGISIIPWQAAAADVRTKQLAYSRISGHSLVRQTGWLYPKMTRLPRTVAEVMKVFETVRPHMEAAVRPPRDG